MKMNSTLTRIVIITLVGMSIPSLAQARARFSNASVRGTYIFGFSGTVLSSGPGLPGPIAGTGLLIADGEGNLQGSENFNDAGTNCTGSLSGTYSVNSDGTATATVNFTNGSTSPCADAVVHEALTLSRSGDLAHFVSTDANAVFSGTEERQ